jgi:hypothetical protein
MRWYPFKSPPFGSPTLTKDNSCCGEDSIVRHFFKFRVLNKTNLVSMDPLRDNLPGIANELQDLVVACFDVGILSSLVALLVVFETLSSLRFICNRQIVDAFGKHFAHFEGLCLEECNGRATEYDFAGRESVLDFVLLINKRT